MRLMKTCFVRVLVMQEGLLLVLGGGRHRKVRGRIDTMNTAGRCVNKNYTTAPPRGM